MVLRGEATSPAAWDHGYGHWPSSWPEVDKAAVARQAAQLGGLQGPRDNPCRLMAITSSPAEKSAEPFGASSLH